RVSTLAAAGGWRPQLLRCGTIPMDARLLAPGGELGDGTVGLPSNVLLLRGEAGAVLIDAGAGPLTDEWPGSRSDLLGALAGAGCSTSWPTARSPLSHPTSTSRAGSCETGRGCGGIRPERPQPAGRRPGGGGVGADRLDAAGGRGGRPDRRGRGLPPRRPCLA